MYARLDKNEKRQSKIAKYNSNLKPKSFKNLVSGAKFDQSVNYEVINYRFMGID